MTMPCAPLGCVPSKVPDVEGVLRTFKLDVACTRSLIRNFVLGDGVGAGAGTGVGAGTGAGGDATPPDPLLYRYRKKYFCALEGSVS